MPIKDVCSPNSSGAKPKPQPLPHPPAASRGVKHTPPYGPLIHGRNDQLSQTAAADPSILGQVVMAAAPAELV
jgi:hypothetical protein